MESYKSDLNTVLTNILVKISGANLDYMCAEIATNLQASNSRRIHNEGKNVSGNRIGKYSIKPIYVNPKNSPKKFEPVGKTGRKNFKSGKAHKTRYFNAGYYGFRKNIGRDSTNVNLQLKGGLKAAWQTKKINNNSYAVGFWSEKYSSRAENLEDHFGDLIWGVTQQDKNLVDSIVDRKLNEK